MKLKGQSLFSSKMNSSILGKSLFKFKNGPSLNNKLENLIDMYQANMKKHFEKQELLMFNFVYEMTMLKNEINLLLIQK